MKNKNYLTAVLLTATILFNGCSKKDDDNSNPTPTPTPAPVAAFTYAGAGVQAPATVTFTNSSTNATSYAWDFGDNGNSTDKDPQHTYAAGGVYTVQLTATGAGGTNSISKTVNIQNTPTTCKITSIKLNAMPFTNGSGVSWDTFDGPDVFFKIETQTGTVLYDATSSRFNDITSGSLPVQWNLTTPFSITPLNTNRYIEIYDYDTLDPDDYIGGVGFNPSVSVSGYPSTTTLTYQGVSITLTLQWQ